MNKKIKALAIEAGLYVDVNGEPWPKWMSAEECEEMYEKFAILLIEASAKKVDKVYKQGGGTYGETIRKSFGFYDKKKPVT
jgi:hypothetical protein